MAVNKKIQLFGKRRFILNKTKAREQGYRIFRAWHCCGCCHIDMAFMTVHNARVQFDTPKFADTVRDDMGNYHQCVNTGRGFKEMVQRPKPIASEGAAPSSQLAAEPTDAEPPLPLFLPILLAEMRSTPRQVEKPEHLSLVHIDEVRQLHLPVG